jgi:twinkle protein
MGVVVSQHVECKYCGSSDAGSIYEGDNGTQWFKCFSCGVNRKHRKGNTEATRSEREAKPIKLLEQYLSASVVAGHRGIGSVPQHKYGVRLDSEQIYFPYYKGDDLVGFKVRKLADKHFFSDGTISDGGLFGEPLYRNGGKYITITEGEYDALAAFEMLGNKYPVVSIRNGAQTALADCKKSYEFLDKFENIVICFDNDEFGKKAAKDVAGLFGHKAKIVNLDEFKDANDYLQKGKQVAFVDRWWKAEGFVPDGIINGKNLLERLKKPRTKALVDYPFSELNKLTYGIREGELVTVTAGSGLGKSQFVREIVYHIFRNTEVNIGMLMLEESVEKAGESIMSLHASKPFHLPDTTYTDEEYEKAFNETLGTGRIYLFDHFGSSSVDNIVNRVRYMAKALGCRVVVLDHISIVVSAQDNGDERKAIDEIMTKLRMLVQETGIALICVSHLKRPDGKGHEEGAATSLNQLRGSGSIGQLSDMVLGLERNGQADDKTERNTTRIRVVKNRFSGLTGPTGACHYDHVTGRMMEVFDEPDEPL